MKIIITGATGSLGSHLVKYYSNEGHQVIAVGRWKIPPPNLVKYARYISIDISNEFVLPQADICIHAAAKSGDSGNENEYQLSNVIGTKNLLNALQGCPTFIHISSSSIYNIQANPIKENDVNKNNYNFRSPYGRTKYLSEQIVQTHFSGTRAMIVRARALYGPGDIQIIPRILRLVKNETILRPGFMKINVSMTHYDNLVHAINLFLHSKLNGINVFNVADETIYSFDCIMRKLINGIYKKNLPEKEIPIFLIKLLGKLRMKGITPLLVRALTNDMILDLTKIKNELGYKQVTSFDESLPEILEWIDGIGGANKLILVDKKLPWA